MTPAVITTLAMVGAVVVLAYLFYALFRPERF